MNWSSWISIVLSAVSLGVAITSLVISRGRAIRERESWEQEQVRWELHASLTTAGENTLDMSGRTRGVLIRLKNCGHQTAHDVRVDSDDLLKVRVLSTGAPAQLIVKSGESLDFCVEPGQVFRVPPSLTISWRRGGMTGHVREQTLGTDEWVQLLKQSGDQIGQ